MFILDSQIPTVWRARSNYAQDRNSQGKKRDGRVAIYEILVLMLGDLICTDGLKRLIHQILCHPFNSPVTKSYLYSSKSPALFLFFNPSCTCLIYKDIIKRPTWHCPFWRLAIFLDIRLVTVTEKSPLEETVSNFISRSLGRSLPSFILSVGPTMPQILKLYTALKK